MDFTIPPHLDELRERVRRFISQEVMPLEPQESETEGLPELVLAQLREKVRAARLWAPQLPPAYGGLGLDTVALCLIFAEAGRSTLGPLALNCAAPDEGNMHLLLRAGTPDQKHEFLEPLARGDVRSCFAMTEPAPGAGSDPTLLYTRAVQGRAGWTIDGRKWFATGARGAAFAIVAAVTDPSVPPQQGVSLFLVKAGTPGYRVVRDVPTMTSGGQGGHCELAFEGCVVGDDQVLGGIGNGYRLMQVRLGPARLTHCMRWLGAASRAVEIAISHATARRAFGKALAEHQAVQWMLADSVIDLHASRLMVLESAWRLEQGEKARTETSICKVFVAEAVNRVFDRAIQICGAPGVSKDLILERFYRDARAFRIYDGPSEVHRMVIARELLKTGLTKG
jgi:acyl-CoA dehydrogenase